MGPNLKKLQTHRTTTAAGTAMAALLALSACGGTDESNGEDSASGGNDAPLVLSTFPFGVEEFQEAVVDPFTEMTGIDVEIDTGANADRLSALQLAGGEDPGVDVVLISDYFAAMGQEEGLFQELDPELVPNLEEIADFAVDDSYYGPAYSYQLYGTIYSTEELSENEAADWELWGEDGYSGRLALPDIAPTAGQLMVSGVADTYGSGPYDVDTAYEVLGDWAPGILQFYSSSTEVVNLLVQGEIVAAGSLSGFAVDLEEGTAWTAPDEGRYMATNHAMIAEGSENVEAAHQFIDYLLSVEAQASSAELVSDLPVNLQADIPENIDAVVGTIAEDPIEAGYQTLDPSELVDTRGEWVDRFAREVVSQ
ncbi:extracellular solute-binding protein [Nesterenkonia salmonea]|uniref:Extracellular solute-binding protein n=1 Tax=Nesterenkonia salmonea TaxID=1804987 RepID=A0A5R9BDY0_9MICC|nr:extracellular solute-binding protein [Nesterenkonia salmonea]TLP98857.1 extracellular solute-binding protein [Nesterenkonia salmonea]